MVSTTYMIIGVFRCRISFHRLYVSPKLPPTPTQKRVTPREWLSEGHSRDRVSEGLPSLDDVRKSLIYNIDEAENLGEVPNYNQTSSKPLLYSEKTSEKRPSLVGVFVLHKEVDPNQLAVVERNPV